MSLLKKFIFKSENKEVVLNRLEFNDVLKAILFEHCTKTIVMQIVNFEEINEYYLLIKKIVSTKEERCDSLIEVNEKDIEIIIESLKSIVYEQMVVLSQTINNEALIFSEEEKLCKKLCNSNSELNELIKKF